MPLKGATNVRDLGGYTVRGSGATRWGQVFRSDGLHRLDDDDISQLMSAGVRHFFDLRRAEECAREPCRVECVSVELPSQGVFDTDVATLQTRADGENWLFGDYLRMLEHGGPAFGRLFAALADADGGAALFHCAGGKDRTGLTAALLLTALGVDREQVMDDYLLTNRFRGAEQVPHVVDLFVDHGIARPAAEAMLSAPRWAMEAALETLDTKYGGIECYLTDLAQVSDRHLDRLRARLVA